MEKNNKSSNVTNFALGIILAGVGLIFLLNNIFHYLTIGKLWPLFMLLPAFLLTWLWVTDKMRYYILLFPITILLFYALYFLWLNFTSWYHVETTWPNFLIGPGLGFIGLYFATKKWEYLIPSFILLILAAIFYAAIIENTLIVGILLIAIGILLIFKSLFLKKNKELK